MKFVNYALAACIAAGSASAAFADTIAYNQNPQAGVHLSATDGNNNNWGQAATLTTDRGDQLFLRAHVSYLPYSGSTPDNGVYTFATDQFSAQDHLNDFGGVGHSLSVDFGYSSLSSLAGVTGMLTVSGNGQTASFLLSQLLDSYSYTGNGFNAVANSERLSFPILFGSNFDAGADADYTITLDINGLSGLSETKSLSITADVQSVPEPATWGMFIGGFGLVGGALRRKKASVRFA